MSRIAGDSIVALSMNEATDNTSAATMNTVCPRVRAPARVLSIVMVGDHSDPALQPDQFRQTGETPYCGALFEPKKTLGVGGGDLLLVRRWDRHLLQEFPAGFHVGERVVGGEDD